MNRYIYMLYELNNMTNGHRIITLFEYLHKVFKQIYTKGSPSSSSSTLSSIPNSALLTLPQTSSSALHAHLRAVQSLWSTTTMWYALGFLADTFYQLGIGSWGWGIPCCDWDQVISISLPSIVSWWGHLWVRDVVLIPYHYLIMCTGNCLV